MQRLFLLITVGLLSYAASHAQNWQKQDLGFGNLPKSIEVFRSTDSIDGQPNIAYYVKIDLRDKNLKISTDTSAGRRLTPAQFQQKHPDAIVVMNTTFFSFETHQNLGMIINEGKLLSYNVHALYQKSDSTYRYVLPGSFGLSKKRQADIAWVFTDSAVAVPRAWQQYSMPLKGNFKNKKPRYRDLKAVANSNYRRAKKWRMQTAVAGGPVLVQENRVAVYNNEEAKFAGKAINDRHPRTAIGYTSDGFLILMAVEGRRPGIAAGVTLTQLANMFVNLGCSEALNLDGGGSSCLLVNSVETIKPSDKEGNQRAIPGILLVERMN